MYTTLPIVIMSLILLLNKIESTIKQLDEKVHANKLEERSCKRTLNSQKFVLLSFMGIPKEIVLHLQVQSPF